MDQHVKLKLITKKVGIIFAGFVESSVIAHDFVHAAYTRWWSFEDRQKKVLSSRCSIEKSKEQFVLKLKKGRIDG